MSKKKQELQRDECDEGLLINMNIRLQNVSMPLSNPEVEAGDATDSIIGYKKRRVSLKQGLAGVFQRIQSSQSNVDCNRPDCSM